MQIVGSVVQAGCTALSHDCQRPLPYFSQLCVIYIVVLRVGRTSVFCIDTICYDIITYDRSLVAEGILLAKKRTAQVHRELVAIVAVNRVFVLNVTTGSSGSTLGS